MKRRVASRGSKGSAAPLRWYVLVGHIEGEGDEVWRGQARAVDEALRKFSRRLKRGLSASDRASADILMTAVFSAAERPAVLFDGERWFEERAL